MSSQKTEYYELNQWLPTDQVLRTDFNADNAKIDAALNTLAGQVAAKADAAGLDALSGTVAGHTAQLTQKGNCQVYYGTYTGNGSVSNYRSFPAKPLMVTIMGDNNWLTAIQGNPDAMYKNAGAGAGKVNASWLGNAVTFQHENAVYPCNSSGQVYRVVAVMAVDG